MRKYVYIICAFVITLLPGSPALPGVPMVEPEISVYQGSEKGSSVLVLTWPNGNTQKLVFKDTYLNNGTEDFMKWIDQRINEYNRH